MNTMESRECELRGFRHVVGARRLDGPTRHLKAVQKGRRIVLSLTAAPSCRVARHL